MVEPFITDEDLNRIKATMNTCQVTGLITRLEASEKIVWLVKRYVERQYDTPDCRCDFCVALRKWEDAAGKV